MTFQISNEQLEISNCGNSINRHFIPRNDAKKRLKNSFFKITSENYIFSKNGPENFI